MQSSQKGSPREATLKAGEAGQSLLELIVVIAVSTMIVGALAFATIFSIRNAQLSKNQSQATKLAQEGIEKVRSIRDRNSEITVGGGGTLGGRTINSFADLYEVYLSRYCEDNIRCYFKFVSDKLTRVTNANNNVDFENISSFRRQVLIEDSSQWDSEKQVTVLVQWTDFSCGSNQFCHESRLTTIFRKL